MVKSNHMAKKKEDEINYRQSDLTDTILQNAIQSRASDIHLDPEIKSFRVRFRIDGTLYEIENLAKDVQEIVISRIKVLAGMDIMEHRIPQDGHLEFMFQATNYNLRVSTFPTPHGEAVVLRLLNRENMLLPLENLGLDADQLEDINSLIQSPYGIILITGPSNSGKTTLLYSILNVLNTPENNIVTVEEPIEFQMENIRQMQIDASIGLTFSKAMRAILRQDPEIIMLGEIRDPDTIQMAAQAALSGRLVFSTFHTFDVPALVMRLIEMGIPSSIVSHTLLGVVSVRLIRRVCSSCKAPYSLSEFEQKFLGDQEKTPGFQKGKGCKACQNSGYLGRIGIFEVLRFDEDIQSHILAKKSIASFRTLLKEKQIKTLRGAAVEKVRQGITTVEEVLRVVGRGDSNKTTENIN